MNYANKVNLTKSWFVPDYNIKLANKIIHTMKYYNGHSYYGGQ